MKDQVFLNDLINYGDAFIVVFQAGGTVLDNREDYHMKSIEQAAFFNFNHFCRMVIQNSTFGMCLMFLVAARHMGACGPEITVSSVPPTMFWDSIKGLPTTFTNIDMFGHNNI